MTIVEALHREWPALSYDVTIKVEHLLRHRDLLPGLKETGCLFVTTAVESLDDAVLEKLGKGTRAPGSKKRCVPCAPSGCRSLRHSFLSHRGRH